ncbi:MAG: hypothetical protein ACRC2R_09595 [Xenococcaceae cyanobacterium]
MTTFLQKLVQYCIILTTILNSLNFYWSNKLLIEGYLEQLRQKFTPSLIIEADRERSQENI